MQKARLSWQLTLHKQVLLFRILILLLMMETVSKWFVKMEYLRLRPLTLAKLTVTRELVGQADANRVSTFFARLHRMRHVTNIWHLKLRGIGLENLVLKLADLHLDPMDLEFVHNPDKKNLQLAKLLLERLEALKDGQITEIGIEMEKMPVSARIARMLIEAKKYSPQVQGDMAIIGAILECGDFRGKKFYVPAMLTDECKKSDLTYQLLLVKTINNLWHTLEGRVKE